MSHPRRRLSRWVAALSIAAVAALVGSTPAQAGRYHVFYCTTPTGAPASTSDWEYTRTDDGQSESSCPNYVIVRLGHGEHGSGQQSTAGFVAKSDVSILWMRADRSASILDTATADINASPTFWSAYGNPAQATGDGCSFFAVSPWSGTAPCRGVAWAGVSPGSSISERSFDGGTKQVGFIAGCGGSGVCGAANVANESRVTLLIHAVDLLMDDTNYPSVHAGTGSLSDGGTERGTAGFSYSASDAGAGVYQSILYVDGSEVDRRTADGSTCSPIPLNQGYGWELQFDHMTPCPASSAFSQTLDTTRLSEGSHRVQVIVRDASGNPTTALDKTITVDNVPPPSVNIAPSISGGAPAGGLRPGDALVAVDGTWNGAGIAFTHRWQRQTDAGAWIDIAGATGAKYTVVTDDVGHALRVVVTATNGEGSASAVTEGTAAVRSGATVQTQSLAPTPTPAPAADAAVVSPGSGYGAGGNTATGQLVLDREQKSVDVKYDAKVVITGRLVDAQNQPIANAQVDVFEQLVTTTAPWNKVGTIKTDSQGGYMFRPKTTGSRRLRFAWTDKIGTADYRATREVLVSVTAGMAIRAKHRTVGRRDTIKLSGRVSIDGLPKKGAWVEVQVLDARVWRTVSTRPLSSKGGWTFKHKLTSSARITFAFRARMRATGAIPAVESKSSVVKVKVR